jgi:hypothetical protein
MFHPSLDIYFLDKIEKNAHTLRVFLFHWNTLVEKKQRKYLECLPELSIATFKRK